MTAPIERRNALVTKLNAAFLDACPDIPLCRERITEVFREIHSHSADDPDDLIQIACLADDLGLEFSIALRRKE